jgi:hypothetical protein
MIDEIEQERLEALSERDAEEPGWRERYKPGTFGCHEALHTSALLMELVGSRLMEHGAIIQDERRYALADRAHRALFELYQAIGAIHLEAEIAAE